jgi:methionine biosynthesis protein MetW
VSIKGEKKLFDLLWSRKLEANPDQTIYAPGANLRVDKALASLQQGSRILDVGCGNGVFLLQAQRYFDEAYGVDIAAAAVSLARKNGVTADVVDLNSQDLPYQDNYFDCLVLLSTLQYFYDLDKVLNECHRVLSPSGTLLLSVPNMRALWRVVRILVQGSFPRVSLDKEGYDGGTLHYFAYSNLYELLTKNGFKVLWAHGIFCMPAFINHFPDRSFIGTIKREFFSAEVFVTAIKLSKME